ncbi:hypothetical protein AYJ54_16800 [Bradyrhizobium centrolobii]|uniref:OpgC protein n=2 Tax=Bradyrhizobium centrolobii TaxID=1505087 RepID=A0A176YNM4_9BRAD|nr:hypothetical protein AYJ54_16800 [Bradyrhizobium centrolobii]
MACGDHDRHCDAEAILDPADRDFRIDLFRGLALWWIFLDHVPETYLNHFTPKNFGLSDAAEILVFLSGLASGSVYGSVARQSGSVTASLRVLRRAFEIYLAQIITVVVLLTQISLLAVRQPSLLDHANLAVFVARPAETMFQAMMLRYTPVDLDPLLLMAILHFGLVLALPVMIRWPTPVLVASAVIYFLAHWFDWSIPAYPRGVIYFNPLDWQLLYVMGVWWGMKHVKEQPAILKSRLIAGLAAIYLLFSLFITLGWHFHSLEAYVPAAIVRAIYPIDKGDLDILRLLHFLALALLCWRLLPCNLPVLRTRVFRPLVQCGEYSLPIYCVSVLLSFAAHAILNMGWNSLASQTLVSVAGIAVMAAIAGLLARIDRTATSHPRTL